MEARNNNNKPENLIRIGAATRVRSVINYCLVLLKKDVKDLHLNAMGGAIGSLIIIAENVKLLHPGLFQVNTISTVNSQTVDGNGSVLQQKLFPKLEITLTTVQPDASNVGYQAALTEENRENMLKVLNELNSRKRTRNTRRAPRGGQRGSRGAPRGQRGGRGAPRGGPRGAPRGGRGAPRGQRGGRGAPRGGPRGGRGAPRGGPRGGRGAPRGGPRGGQRGAPRGNTRRGN